VYHFFWSPNITVASISSSIFVYWENIHDVKATPCYKGGANEPRQMALTVRPYLYKYPRQYNVLWLAHLLYVQPSKLCTSPCTVHTTNVIPSQSLAAPN